MTPHHEQTNAEGDYEPPTFHQPKGPSHGDDRDPDPGLKISQPRLRGYELGTGLPGMEQGDIFS